MSCERRHFARLDTYLYAWVRPFGGKRFCRCQVVELSEGGAQLLVDPEQKLQGLLEVYVDVEADWQVACMAYVLRSQPLFFGTRRLLAATLKASKPEERSLFRLWIRNQLSIPAEPEPSPVSRGWAAVIQKLKRASGWPRLRSRGSLAAG